MKFSTNTVATIITLTVSAVSTDAFSVGSKTGPRMDPFGIQGLTQRNARKFAPSAFPVVLSAATTDAAEPEVDDEVQRLQAMAAKLRQEAAELEAIQASERAQAVEKAFNTFDTNGDGELSIDELKAALEKTFKLDLPEDRVQRLMNDFDKSGDGKLQKEEFVSIDQFRNQLEALAAEERQKALAASKAAQQEEELAKLIDSQMELINDKPPSNSDKVVSVLPYLLPLMDGLLFGQFLLAGNESNPAVGALALLYTVYRSIPFSGFLAFFGLSALSGNLSINRLVRYNIQQAIFLDVALFVPGLIGTLAGAAASSLGAPISPLVGQLSSDAVFVTLIAILGYSAVSSLLGSAPDKVPFISEAVTKRLPTADMIEFINPSTGEPIVKNRNEDRNDGKSNNDKKED